MNDDGSVRLELRTPFNYLRTLADEIERIDVRVYKGKKRGCKAKKNAGGVSPGVPLSLHNLDESRTIER